MKTLQINTEKGWRGGESQTTYLTKGLKQRSHEAIIVAKPDSALYKKSEEHGLQVIPIKMRSEFDLIAVLQIAAIMKREKIDICHMHTPHSVTLGSAAAAIAKVPVTVVSRRVDFSLKGNPFRKIKYQYGISRIIAVSNGVKDILIKDGISPEKISVIYEGVNITQPKKTISKQKILSEFGIKNCTPIVGNIAHLTSHKGHKYLLDAVPLVLEKVPGTKFVIFGSGELETELKMQADRLGITSDVIFAGFRHNIEFFLKTFDIFVMSSTLEGLCTSILDAMAASIPVIATRVGGMPEIVKHLETGLIVEPMDHIRLAKGITELLLDQKKAKEMGENGHKRVKEFSCDRMVDNTIKLYKGLLSQV